MAVSDIIDRVKKEWSQPRNPIRGGEIDRNPLVCSFYDHGVSEKELDKLRVTIPDELKQFWTISEKALLFKDVEYGQWGLETLSPAEAMYERAVQVHRWPEDYYPSDLVIGKFWGDLELVLVRCNPDTDDFGHIIVALPIDGREDWYIVSKSFEHFLSVYVQNSGDKYWQYHHKVVYLPP
jgi:hypothetical protein